MIRSEKPEDAALITNILNDAFHPSVREAQLVELLRKNPLYNPELSLLVYEGEKAVGYILFFPLVIETESVSITTLALCPLGVRSNYQNKGYGTALIMYGLEKAKGMGYSSVFVLGSTEYYGKFGFRPTAIKSSLGEYGEHFMSLELQSNFLKNVTGLLRYTLEFDIVK